MRICTHILALLVAVSASASLARAEGVAWRTDVEAAQREAAASGRLVLLHFSAARCPPCRLMEKNVFSRADVVQAIERHYVPVAIDADTNVAMKRKYSIDGWPADVIVTPAGQVIHASKGGKSAEAYLALIGHHARFAQNAGNPAAPGAVPPTSQQPLPPSPGAPAPPPVPPPGSLAQSPFESRVGQQYPDQPPPNGVVPGNPGMPPSAGPPPSSPFGPGASPPWAIPGTTQPPQQPQLPAQPQQPGGPVAPPWGPPPAAQPSNPFGLPSAPSLPGVVGPPVAVQPPQPAQPALPPLGFQGYCVVTMHHQERWILGDKRWGVIHEGRLYLFANEEAKKLFWQNPARYAPVFGGDDVAVFVESGQRVPGQLRFGSTYGMPGEAGRPMYLFASEEALQRFERDPAAYVMRWRQMMTAAANAASQPRR